jgi:hypothetical protein
VFKYWGKELTEQGFIKEERDLFDYKCNILSHQYIMNQLLKDTNGNVRRALVHYSGYKDVYADKVLGRMNDLTHHMNSGVSPENTTSSSHHKTTKKKR